MNTLQKWVIKACCMLLLPSLLQGMFIPTTRGARAYTRGRATRPVKRPIGPTIQKRGLYTPEQLKQFSVLTTAGKKVSPALGAAIYSAGILPKMYSVQSDAPAVQLVKELFYEQGPQFKPTVSKSKAAYALTPSILGLVMGALESNKLQNPQVRKDVIDQWRAEYKNITDGDKISEKKVDDLLNLITEIYQKDKDNTRSILLGFLYAKANPDSNHDMLHYLTSLNKYLSVFEQGKTIEAYTIPQAPSTSEKSSSLMGKFTTMMQNLKNYIYTPEDYAALQNKLKNVTNPEEAITLATSPENFEHAIAAIINKTQQSPFYPPQVIQTELGYKGQQARPNCVESGVQDLFNIILFNIDSKTFDLSLLPTTIKPSDTFIHFYSLQNESSKANSPAIAQDFMNLVSNVPGVSYSMNNYELKGKDTEKNLLILANHFLQTNATDLESLGKALSDERRTISFTVERNVPTKTRFGNADDIIITINNHQENIEQKAHFYFVSGHGWLDVPARNIKTSEYLLEPSALAKEYNISPQAQALLSLQPSLSILETIDHAMPASFYYIFNFNTVIPKIRVMEHILTFSTDNQEATDYAYKLYQELTPSLHVDLFPGIMETGVQKTNKKFENIYKTLQSQTMGEKVKIMEAIITYDQTNQEAVFYAYDLYKNFDRNYQFHYLNTILKSGIQKTNKNFENIYKTLQPQTAEEKESIIKAILGYDATNQEAVDYAYSLYQSLHKYYQIYLLSYVLLSDAQKTNKNFENIYRSLHPETVNDKFNIIGAILSHGKDNRDAIDYAYTLYKSIPEASLEQLPSRMNNSLTDIMRTIINSDKSNEKEMDYAFSLFEKLDVGYQYRFFEDIMTSGVWKTNEHFSNLVANNPYEAITAAIYTENFNTETIKALYENLKDSGKKNRFLTLVLDAVDSAVYSSITHIRNNKEVTVSPEDLVNITKELLSLGCDINAASVRRSSKDLTPLFIAIEIGNVPLLELLIEHGANINGPVTSKTFDEIGDDVKLSTLTLLQYAVQQAKPKMIETLLKHGADINAKDSSDPNITPLIIAILEYSRDITKLLLENGADPNISGTLPDGKIITPLLAAVSKVESGRNDIITELIQHNVDLNAKDADGNSALDIALEQKIKHRWNMNNSYETVEILQKAGAKAYKKHTQKSEAEME